MYNRRSLHEWATQKKRYGYIRYDTLNQQFVVVLRRGGFIHSRRISLFRLVTSRDWRWLMMEELVLARHAIRGLMHQKERKE